MKCFCAVVLMVSLLIPLNASAQDATGLSSGAILERSQKMRDFYLMEKQLEEEQDAPGDKTDVELEVPIAAEEIESSAVTFYIKEVETNPSAILSGEELQELFSSYEGREVSIAELLSAVEQVNRLYQSKGFATAKAFLPVQKVEGGIVRIKLVEARYDQIYVEGNQTTPESFVLNGLPFSTGDLISLEELKRSLVYFNTVNDIHVRAELKKGAREGTTDCYFKVEEPNRHHVVIYTDNAGRRETGKERLGLIYTNRSLLGLRDVFSLGGYKSEGGDSFHVSYELPLNSFGTRFGGYYDYNETDILSGALGDLNLTGKSRDVSVFLEHPLLIKDKYDIRGYAQYHWKASKTEFEDSTLFETDVSSFVAGAFANIYDRSGFWYIDNKITSGFDKWGGDKSFLKYNLDLARRQSITDDLFLVIKASGQISDTNLLPSSEQFQIGGMATVRGYSEGIRTGDDGYLVSVELNTLLPWPEVRIGEVSLQEAVRGIVFFDHGGAFPYKGNNESITSDDYLTSAGVGFALNFNNRFSGRLFLGVPLATRETDQSDVSVHFYLQFTPFD